MVSIGELALCCAEAGVDAALGRTNTMGSTKACIIKLPGELIASCTSESAENVSEKKVRIENPTMCPVCAHILVAIGLVAVSVSAGGSVIGVRVDRTPCGSMPSAALRLRVSATLALSLPPGGTGGVLCTGASAKGLNHSEVSVEADIAAPDKIGMSMNGMPNAAVTYFEEGADFDHASSRVVHVEVPLDYFTVSLAKVVHIGDTD